MAAPVGRRNDRFRWAQMLHSPSLFIRKFPRSLHEVHMIMESMPILVSFSHLSCKILLYFLKSLL